MGRRALRKVHADPTCHLKTVEQLPCPFAAAAVFGRQAPLEIEVGCGKGLFMMTASGEHPDRDFLGVEIVGRYARHTAARLASVDRRNALMVHGDALRLFNEFLIPESVQAVHVYFPDPWWKKRHHKRRVITEPFVQRIEEVLVTGGEFHFWTDVAEYFSAAMAMLDACTNLAGPVAVSPSVPQHDLDYRTHFERRMRLNDLPVYRSLFRKGGERQPETSTLATS